jgi:glutamate dehydrogenase
MSASFSALPPQARALASNPEPVLIVTKANTRSTVHRAGYTKKKAVEKENAKKKARIEKSRAAMGIEPRKRR